MKNSEKVRQKEKIRLLWNKLKIKTYGEQLSNGTKIHANFIYNADNLYKKMNDKIYKRKGIWYFDDYFNYISSIRDIIPKDIVNFVANPQFYGFGSKSLYDAKVGKFELTYNKKTHLPVLSIKFAGAYKNNYIFKFGNIKSIVFPNNTKGLFEHELLIHQFHLRGNGIFQYEFIFSNNTKLKILFRKLSIDVENK